MAAKRHRPLKIVWAVCCPEAREPDVYATRRRALEDRRTFHNDCGATVERYDLRPREG